MAPKNNAIPVIDLFAGPGGLGEGFSSYTRANFARPFRIALSIERDPIAHQTLQLRSFFRQFQTGCAPDDYYNLLRGKLTTNELFTSWPHQALAASNEAWNAELGKIDIGLLRRRIRAEIADAETWVLIGGPPCQAYSLVGRSRNRGIQGYSLEKDPKAKLYVEYLQIIADFWPPIFVMENVKGLLSSRLDGESIFQKILHDLRAPSEAIAHHGLTRRNERSRTYTLYALNQGELFPKPSDFVVRSEEHGVPQARHRVFIIGIRDDLSLGRLTNLRHRAAPAISDVIGDLPRIRSGLSREEDSNQNWTEAALEICRAEKLQKLAHGLDANILGRLNQMTRHASKMEKLSRGAEYMVANSKSKYEASWFSDPKLHGICNHTARGHIREDLHRYLFAACFAEELGRSPEISEFPKLLLPRHRNVGADRSSAGFADRFRVQHRYRYATTVTSHIGKDGHYYIHYDPTQCRSLTVREAARIQTFPDNYFFTGARTAQYQQVGNAVPPLLAMQIAESVFAALN